MDVRLFGAEAEYTSSSLFRDNLEGGILCLASIIVRLRHVCRWQRSWSCWVLPRKARRGVSFEGRVRSMVRSRRTADRSRQIWRAVYAGASSAVLLGTKYSFGQR